MAVSPITTQNSAGNITNATALAAGATSAAFLIDNSAKFGCELVITVVYGGTVAATAGVQVDIYPSIGGAAGTDSKATFFPTVAAVSATKQATICYLPEGKHYVKVKNLDATNALGSFSLTTNTTDSVG